MATIQRRLIQAREQAGLSQGQTAKLIDTTKNAVSRWENGACLPQITTLQKLARVYGVSVGWLIEGEPSGNGDEIRALAAKFAGAALYADDLRKIADLLDSLAPRDEETGE